MRFTRTNHKAHLIFLWSIVLCAIFSGPQSWAESPKYKDASLPINARVDDLLQRMTLEEKVAQLQAVWVKRQALET